MSLITAIKNVKNALMILGLVEGAMKVTDSEQKRTLAEEIEVEGKQLLERVRDLIQEGNIRRLVIKDDEGKTLLEIPLTVGVVAGGVFAFYAPILAAVGALAALVTRVRIEIIRTEDDGEA